ncbi:dispanin family [Octopus vulgaris]|uniref:Dispanin family n=1 Tax=Octopus vulgaris TaxID=6645 RepID=A0AA36AM33_OCTVU|nr:dispanin family [Octopus vulgaris]
MDSEENLITTETVTTEVVVKTEVSETSENTTTIIVPQPEEKTVVQVTTTQETVTVEKNVEVEENENLEEEIKLEEKEDAEKTASGTQKADLHIVINQEPTSAEVQQTMVAEGIKKENNLVKAILVTIFCCLPLGIVAIIQANKANTELKNGNLTEAVRSNESAKKFIKYGLIIGLLFSIIIIIVKVAI